MTAGLRYLTGVGIVAAAGSGLLLASRPVHPGALFGLVVGLALQGPLGWWVVRSLGTERFLTIWGIGLLMRFVLLALVGIVVVPALGWPAAPVLLALAGTLAALLAVEGMTAWLEHSNGTV